MTKVNLLLALKAFTEDATKNLLLPVKRQSEKEPEPEPRPAAVYLARLPDMNSPTKKAPYILHRAVTGTDELVNANQGRGMEQRWTMSAKAVVRSIFCVYDVDEQQGGLALLGLMERMRIALLEQVVIGNQFKLDIREGVSTLVYPETGERGSAPFYLGEMVTQWDMPPIERNVTYGKEGYSNIKLGGAGAGCDPLDDGRRYGIGVPGLGGR